MFGILIAEYGSWQEAVCSNDFEEINGNQYEKIKELEKRLENLTNNYKLLEKQQAGDIAHGQALVDEFGDFGSVCEELQRLRDRVDWEAGKNKALEKQLNEAKEEIRRSKKAFETLCDTVTSRNKK